MRIAGFFICSLLILTTPSGVLANPTEKKPDKEEKKTPPEKEEKTPPLESVIDGEVEIGGVPVAYRATSGQMVLKKKDGKEHAKVFYTAYELAEEAKEERPVSFCFNGGPGAAALWLHIGGLGPKRVVLEPNGVRQLAPPFKVADNPWSILDKTDLVFIDPVSTGYSRPAKPDQAKDFHGFKEDIESVGEFIRLYTTQNERWGSPKFLIGESYGAIRAAGLAQHVQREFGMYLNGVVLLSGLLDFGTLMTNEGNDRSYLTFLPTYTAVAHYHSKLPPKFQKRPLGELLKEVEAFAEGDYAKALYQGARLEAKARKSVISRLSNYSGIKEEIIEEHDLRIAPNLFRSELMKDEKKQVGRFDARVLGDLHSSQYRDPSFDLVAGPFSSAMKDYLRRGLKVEVDDAYHVFGDVHPWDYSTFTNKYVNVTSQLSSAMNTNHHLKVLVMCGYTDLATPYAAIRHSMDRLEVSEDLRSNISFTYYSAGHMMYTEEASQEKLKRDLDDFINASNTQQK